MSVPNTWHRNKIITEYVPHAVSRTQIWVQWLHNANLLGGPNRGDKIIHGCINLAGAQIWAKWLHHPCLLGGPHQGDKIKSGCILGQSKVGPLGARGYCGAFGATRVQKSINLVTNSHPEVGTEWGGGGGVSALGRSEARLP